MSFKTSRTWYPLACLPSGWMFTVGWPAHFGGLNMIWLALWRSGSPKQYTQSVEVHPRDIVRVALDLP